MRRLIPFFSAAAGILLVLVSGGTATAETDDDFTLSVSLTTRLAYVMTGNREVDRTSHAGLSGLSLIVNRRTAAELGEPIAVSPDADELSFFPFLYWPVTKGHEPPSAGAVARLNAYLRSGGTIFFDTRGGEDGSGTADLRQLARHLDIPSLEPIPADHVLGRAYYLMGEFPGRWTGRALWVERAGERINDGVSSVIVGSHDWAAAWAVDEAQRPLYAVVPGGERQREWAFRFGINLVMYTLTGNYKADQVHLPAIIQRLGQ